MYIVSLFLTNNVPISRKGKSVSSTPEAEAGTLTARKPKVEQARKIRTKMIKRIIENQSQPESRLQPEQSGHWNFVKQ